MRVKDVLILGDAVRGDGGRREGKTWDGGSEVKGKVEVNIGPVGVGVDSLRALALTFGSSIGERSTVSKKKCRGVEGLLSARLSSSSESCESDESEAPQANPRPIDVTPQLPTLAAL